MHRFLVFVGSVSVLSICAGSYSSAEARDRLIATPSSMSEESSDLRGGYSGHLRAAEDTVSFGSVGVDGFALEGERWTWDHGGIDPMEGWDSIDLTVQAVAWFRHIDDTNWAGGGNTVPAPVLAGAGSAWVGAFEDEADALCWDAGTGYGNHWNQRLTSPPFVYAGSGDVSLSFTYFSDSEEDFDYTRLFLRRGNGTQVSLNGDGFTGPIGMNGSNPPVGASFSTTLVPSDFGGDTSFTIVFEFSAGDGWSDEDGSHDTAFGPFGVDDLTVSGAVGGGPHSYAFETDLEGWTPQAIPGFGSLVGVAPLANYLLGDACQCNLAGNVLEFHDDTGEHPYGQHALGRSNPVDVLNDVLPLLPGPAGAIRVMAGWEQYSHMPRANGVFYRPGWDYYPYECPASGAIQWSGRVGQDNFFYVGNDPLCVENLNTGSTNGVPSDIQQVRFLFEVYASCDAFGIPPSVCTEENNFTPIIDNVHIDFSREAIAPSIAFGSGTRYRDTFPLDGTLSPTSTGRCDIIANVNFGSTEPFIQGDSLYISGPNATSSTRWESRLWFRVARKGPAQNGIIGYAPWRDRVADGNDIENGEFTFAWMDSFQLGTQTAKNKYVSYLRESDDDYHAGSGEFGEGNEILPDAIFVPGTEIEYFVSSNYTASPSENFVLPDTTGGLFLELAVLPRYQEIDGVWKFPTILHIDADNRGFTQRRFEAALNVALHGANPTDPLPAAPLWDRFDYMDSGCCWTSPFARGNDPRSISGATLVQLLGYRALICTAFSSHSFWPTDYELFSSWLTAIYCDGDERQGFILNADLVAPMLHVNGNAFSTELGFASDSDFATYQEISGDDNYCVRITDAPGAEFPSALDYDAWGNGCPDEHPFSILQPVGTGVPSRSYENVSNGEITGYQQITNESISGNYRSVSLGSNYVHLSTRESGDECTPTFDRIVRAAAAEIESALNWMFDGAIPGRRENPNCIPVEIGEDGGAQAMVTRVFAPQPNPVAGRTLLRFQLAAAGDADLTIFDVAGRRVRALVRGEQTAGVHEIVWDGNDDRGEKLPAGIYWSQLEAAGYRSGKKLVVLR